LNTLSVEKEGIPLDRAGGKILGWAWLIPWGLVALAVALFFFRAHQYGGFFAEDAYISFRFADNLANGHGLVWNIGQEPVEGYTSPLHIALLALGVKLGIPIVLLATLIGFLSLAGLVGIYLGFLRKELGQLTIIGAVVISIFLIDSRLAVHATAGLDTVLFMFLLAASFAVSVYFVTSPSWLSASTLAVTNLLALLGRPDAAPFIAGQAAVILVYALYQYYKQRNARFGLYSTFSYGLLLTLGTGYLAWKISYFGYLFPNPFYIKATDPLALHGAFSVAKFGVVSMSRYGLILLPALFFIDYSRVKEWLRPSATRVKVALLLAPPIVSLLYYLTVLPEVNYLSRFEYPTLIFFCLAGAILLSVGTPFQNLRTRTSGILHPKLVPVAFAVGVVLFSAFIYRVTQVYFPWFQIVEEGFYRPIGEALESTGLGSEATLVFDSAGVVPFISQFTHIDPVGLTDNVLSGREPISVWERESYIWSKNPDVYIGPEPPASPGATGCSDDSIIQSRYAQSVLLGEARPNINGAYLHIYGALLHE
jgi:arabinofuranosyltransferase